MRENLYLHVVVRGGEALALSPCQQFEPTRKPTTPRSVAINAYCKVVFNGEEFKTATREKELAPVWNERFVFKLPEVPSTNGDVDGGGSTSDSEDSGKKPFFVYIYVYHHSKENGNKDKLIGTAKVPISGLEVMGETIRWCDLKRKKKRRSEQFKGVAFIGRIGLAVSVETFARTKLESPYLRRRKEQKQCSCVIKGDRHEYLEEKYENQNAVLDVQGDCLWRVPRTEQLCPHWSDEDHREKRFIHVLYDGWCWSDPEWKIDLSWSNEKYGWKYGSIFAGLHNNKRNGDRVRSRRWCRKRGYIGPPDTCFKVRYEKQEVRTIHGYVVFIEKANRLTIFRLLSPDIYDEQNRKYLILEGKFLYWFDAEPPEDRSDWTEMCQGALFVGPDIAKRTMSDQLWTIELTLAEATYSLYFEDELDREEWYRALNDPVDAQRRAKEKLISENPDEEIKVVHPDNVPVFEGVYQNGIDSDGHQNGTVNGMYREDYEMSPYKGSIEENVIFRLPKTNIQHKSSVGSWHDKMIGACSAQTCTTPTCSTSSCCIQ